MLLFQLELAQSGKFNSQIHVDFMWETQSQELYDSEDDLDERVSHTHMQLIWLLTLSLYQKGLSCPTRGLSTLVWFKTRDNKDQTDSQMKVEFLIAVFQVSPKNHRSSVPANGGGNAFARWSMANGANAPSGSRPCQTYENLEFLYKNPPVNSAPTGGTMPPPPLPAKSIQRGKQLMGCPLHQHLESKIFPLTRNIEK